MGCGSVARRRLVKVLAILILHGHRRCREVVRRVAVMARVRGRTRVVRPVHIVPGLVRVIRLAEVLHRRPVHRPRRRLRGGPRGAGRQRGSLSPSLLADLTPEPARGDVGYRALWEVGVGVGVRRGVRHVRRVLLAPFRYRRHHRAIRPAPLRTEGYLRFIFPGLETVVEVLASRGFCGRVKVLRDTLRAR